MERTRTPAKMAKAAGLFFFCFFSFISAVSAQTEYYTKRVCNGNVASCELSSPSLTGYLMEETLNTCDTRYGSKITCSVQDGVVVRTYSSSSSCTGNVTNVNTLAKPGDLAVGGVYDSSTNTTVYDFNFCFALSHTIGSLATHSRF